MGKKAKGKKKERKRAAALAALERSEAPPSDVLAIPVQVPEQRRASSTSGRRRAIEPAELAARLAGLSTVLRRNLAHADAAADGGLTRARLSALALLVLGGPRTLGDLAAAERVKPPTMTRMVHAMEADGLVTREPNPSDGRSIIIHATPLGERQLAFGRAQQIAPLAERISDLDRDERLLLEDASDLLERLLRDADWESSELAE